jgi:NADP-dependent 3-hydroxy acid dehydrogenase YdfG
VTPRLPASAISCAEIPPHPIHSSGTVHEQSILSAGRTALITGGSRGIGRMIASGFLAQGARAYISERKAASCDQTAQEFASLGQCISLLADASTVEGAKALAAAYAAHKPQLDILMKNSPPKSSTSPPSTASRSTRRKPIPMRRARPA